MRFNGRTKYRAKRCQMDGHNFDSQTECEYYAMLKMMAESGHVKILELQPKIYMTNARILYKPDFFIEQNGEQFYVDVKGIQTTAFRIKLRLWKHYGSGKLVIVAKIGGRFQTTAEIHGGTTKI